MWGNISTEATFQTNFNIGFSNTTSDILIHLSLWQYWWWFWFAFVWSLYFFILLRVIKYRTLKFRPKIVTSMRSHGKWGDLIICMIPASWCINIIINSSFLLKMIEWQSENCLFTIRIRGRQWYWVYKFDLKDFTEIISATKNVGRNKWLFTTSGNLNSMCDYLDIVNVRASTNWLNKYWSEGFLLKQGKFDNFAVSSQLDESLDLPQKKYNQLSDVTKIYDFYLNEHEPSDLFFFDQYFIDYGRLTFFLKTSFIHFDSFRSFSEFGNIMNLSTLIRFGSKGPYLESIQLDAAATNRLYELYNLINQLYRPTLLNLTELADVEFNIRPFGDLDYYDDLLSLQNKDTIIDFWTKNHYMTPKHIYGAKFGYLGIFDYFFNNKKMRIFSDFEESLRWAKRSFGSVSPLRVIKLPINNYIVDNMDNYVDIIRFRFNTENTIKHKPISLTNYYTFKQKRYKVTNKIDEVKRFFRDSDGNYSKTNIKSKTKPFLINNSIFTNEIKQDLSKTLRLFQKNKNHGELFPVSLYKRLLRTRRTLVLPAHVNVSAITNSYDVVHSWFIPGLGLKLDCIPGRATHHTIYIDNVGFYYGQCAEICGRYHHHMPIKVCALPFEHFIIWWQSFGLPKLTFTNTRRKYNTYYNFRKFVW